MNKAVTTITTKAAQDYAAFCAYIDAQAISDSDKAVCRARYFDYVPADSTQALITV